MEIPVTLILGKTCSYFRMLKKQPWTDVFLFYSYTTNLFPRAEIHPSAEDPRASLYSTEDSAQQAVKKACGWSTTGHITIWRKFQGKVDYFCTAAMIFRTKEKKIRDHYKRGNRFGKLGSKNAGGYPLQLQL